MNRRERLRALNLFSNSKALPTQEPMTVSGQMGDRDPNTGNYRSNLDDGGVVQTAFISGSNSWAGGSTIYVDLNGWGDR